MYRNKWNARRRLFSEAQYFRPASALPKLTASGPGLRGLPQNQATVSRLSSSPSKLVYFQVETPFFSIDTVASSFFFNMDCRTVGNGNASWHKPQPMCHFSGVHLQRTILHRRPLIAHIPVAA